MEKNEKLSIIVFGSSNSSSNKLIKFGNNQNRCNLHWNQQKSQCL